MYERYISGTPWHGNWIQAGLILVWG